MEIGSGYTKVMKRFSNIDGELDGELSDSDWEEFFLSDTTYELLEKMRVPRFSDYMVRYIVYRYEDEIYGDFAQNFQGGADGIDWKEDFISETFFQIEKKSARKHLKKYLAEIAKREFQKNGYENRFEEQKIADKIFVYNINEEDFFTIAFGMNMTLDDVEMFMKKALGRAGFNFRDPKELILYICIKYYDGGKRKPAYSELTKIYDEAENPKIGNVSDAAINANTAEVGELADRLMSKIKDYKTDRLKAGELRQFFEKYKMIIGNPNYVRTKVKVFDGLKKKFYENCKSEIAAEKAINSENEYAVGKVNIYYDFTRGIRIPKGVRFSLTEREDGQNKEYFFTGISEVDIKPQKYAAVKFKVRCARETVIKNPDEKSAETGYAAKHTYFSSPVRELKNIQNISAFKANGTVGDTAFIEGNLTAECGRCMTIPEGTVFKAGEYTYYNIEDVRVSGCAQIGVRADEINVEATKNKLKYSSAGQKNPIDGDVLKIEHSKIKMANATGSKGVSTFLYEFTGDDSFVTLKDKNDAENVYGKLKVMFMDKKLSPKILSKSGSGKISGKDIARKEILNMAFLAYAGQKEFGEEIEDAELDVAAAINDELIRCGFYELNYAAPYDLLLAYMAVREDPVTTYRNLWTWFLNRRRAKKVGCGK